ncbi:MAG: DUF2585 family protein [bacterium]|nr:DUF2585 family protein [bacterium]
MKKYKWIIVAVVVILAVTAAVEFSMGRLPWGPDGKPGLWEADVWSSEQSQRFADPYTFSHIIHGMLFYAFLWLVARRLPLKYRFIGALLLEAGWEILENSPLIINRYREVTISLGYVGDSVFNSLSDVFMAGFGFYLAYKFPVWLTVVLIIAMELGTLFWVRDNLALNVIMLLYPLEAIKAWQSVGHLPAP